MLSRDSNGAIHDCVYVYRSIRILAHSRRQSRLRQVSYLVESNIKNNLKPLHNSNSMQKKLNNLYIKTINKLRETSVNVVHLPLPPTRNLCPTQMRLCGGWAIPVFNIAKKF